MSFSGPSAVSIAAAVLLALVAHDAEGPLHHVDLIGLLELAGHWLEGAATRGTCLVRLVELVDDLDDGKRLLLARSVTWARLLPLVRLLLGARYTLGRIPEQGLRATRELLPQVCDLELKALGLLAACFAQLARQHLEAMEQPGVLLLQQKRCLA